MAKDPNKIIKEQMGINEAKDTLENTKSKKRDIWRSLCCGKKGTEKIIAQEETAEETIDKLNDVLQHVAKQKRATEGDALLGQRWKLHDTLNDHLQELNQKEIQEIQEIQKIQEDKASNFIELVQCLTQENIDKDIQAVLLHLNTSSEQGGLDLENSDLENLEKATYRTMKIMSYSYDGSEVSEVLKGISSSKLYKPFQEALESFQKIQSHYMKKIPNLESVKSLYKSIELRNIQNIENFYKTLKFDKDDKTDELIEENSETKLNKEKDTAIPDYQYITKAFTKSSKGSRCFSMTNAKERELFVADIDKSEQDKIFPSDIAALHFLFSMQQFYGIGTKPNGDPITVLEEEPIILGKDEANALKKDLSPLFSSSSPDVINNINQIPEQLRVMNKLTFLAASNPETKKAMNPRCLPGETTTFLKGTKDYNVFLETTPLGTCAARIHIKYFSHSNIKKIEYKRPKEITDPGDITLHFDYE